MSIRVNSLLLHRTVRRDLLVFLAALLLPACAFHKTMTSQPVELPMVYSAIQIIHAERHNTGGFSSLWLSPDCSFLITISDYSQAKDEVLDKPVRRSAWYQAKLHFNAEDSISDLTFVATGQLKDLDGTTLQGAVESIASDKNGFLISFDDRGTIYRYANLSSKSDVRLKGQALNNKPSVAYSQENLGSGNLGLESITLLNNGDLLALWETEFDESLAQGRLIKTDGQKLDLVYATGASPGGATTLSDGRVLILEKRWLGSKRGQRIRLATIDQSQLKQKNLILSAPIHGKTLFDQTSKYYDNSEGISACRRNGREWIFVITDDNGDWSRANVEDKGHKRQKTLLLQFSLDELTDP